MTGMYSSSSGSPASSYQYRADGLRVLKGVGIYAQPSFNISTWTRYRYDGQMGIEDVGSNSSGTITSLTRYGLGGRGIDVVSTTTASGNTVSYPLYDAHGNNVGLLGKSGSLFTVSNEKSYEAWGGLRTGNTLGGKATYCANIGHKQDNESGLIYMRARYYEANTGRFANEDVARQGFNWYVYANGNPIMNVDYTGKSFLSVFFNVKIIGESICAASLSLVGVIACSVAAANMGSKRPDAIIESLKACALAIRCFMGVAMLAPMDNAAAAVCEAILLKYLVEVTVVLGAAQAGSYTHAAGAVQKCTERSLVIMSFMAAETIFEVVGSSLG